jgi:hypothetical protein
MGEAIGGAEQSAGHSAAQNGSMPSRVLDTFNRVRDQLLSDRSLFEAGFVGVAHDRAEVTLLLRTLDKDTARAVQRFGDDLAVRRTGAIRPLAAPGDAIGPNNPTTDGTLGAIVRDKSGGQRGLSCDHVVGVLAGQSRGAPAWSPPLTSRTAAARIGTFDRGAPVATAAAAPWPRNMVDAALVAFDPHVVLNPSIPGIGVPSGANSAPAFGDRMRKTGAKTGTTTGTYIYRAMFLMTYGSHKALFVDQLGIDGAGYGTFARRGDSGSVVVDDTLRVAGLLFAVAEHSNLAFANPVDHVMSALAIAF